MSGCRRLLSLLRDTPCHKHIILTYLLVVNYYLANLLDILGKSMGIVSRISKCAKEKGLTIAEIERKCGFGTNTLYRWDQSSPALNKVVKVANLIDVSIDYLATGEDRPVSSLSELDQKILNSIHMLNDKTQNDFLGFIEIFRQAHPENTKEFDLGSDIQDSQEERLISSK